MPKVLEIKTAEPTHIQIRKYYQQQIRTGVLKSGDALPSTQDLAEQWNISCTAVQKALANLTAAGLVDRTRRRGTFVSSAAGEVVIGVLVGPSLADESAHFYRILLNAIQQEIGSKRGERHWSCRAYDGLTSMKKGAPAPQGHKQFLRDLENYTFKGLIEIAPGANWGESLTSQAKLPVSTDAQDVRVSYAHFFQESLRSIVERGMKRAAVLNIAGPYPPAVSPMLAAIEAAEGLGLESPEIITIAVKGSLRKRQQMIHEQMAQNIRRWRNADGSYCGPDALIVTDDVAMRSVAMAILQEGIRVPKDLHVICMTIVEVNLYYGIPVTRYEFSAKEVAGLLLDLLWKRVIGEAIPPLPILLSGQLVEDEPA